MVIRNDCLYNRTHQWMKKEDTGFVSIGVTDYAQSQLGEIIFVNLPDVGSILKVSEPFGEIESAKVVSEIYSPVNGTVIEVNESAIDNPELINEDPYGTWLIRASCEECSDEMLDAEMYRYYLSTI